MSLNRYGMYLKNGEDLIHLTQEETIDKAKQYFAEEKKMPLEEFNKIFCSSKKNAYYRTS